MPETKTDIRIDQRRSRSVVEKEEIAKPWRAVGLRGAQHLASHFA